jgi:hypothetical protein
MTRPSKMISIEDAQTPYYHIRTHGGLGDCLWLYKKLHGLDLPVYISVSSENRTRPRRVGRMLDHLPRVVGWRYVDQSFAPNGDWPDPRDPCCAVGKTWNDLKIIPNTLGAYPLECNRWMETGHRIENWLPDLSTTHRVPFLEPGSPTQLVKRPCITVPIAGWPDVPDQTWINTIRLFSGLAHVYLIGGSYDRRPRMIIDALRYPSHVTLLEDAPWEDLFAALVGCEFCFGHASGMTAIADALGLRGAVFNPRSVPGLIGSWNDESNTDLVHVDRVAEFEAAIYTAYTTMMKRPSATWPPSSARGGHLIAGASVTGAGPAIGAVYAAAVAAEPREALVVFDGPGAEPGTSAAIISAAYAGSIPIRGVTVVGDTTADEVRRLYAETARSSRRPVIDLPGSIDVIAGRSVAYDLIVLVGNAPALIAERIRWAWARTSRRGTILIHTSDALRVTTDVFRSQRVTPVEVSDAPDWVYVHRRN